MTHTNLSPFISLDQVLARPVSLDQGICSNSGSIMATRKLCFLCYLEESVILPEAPKRDGIMPLVYPEEWGGLIPSSGRQGTPNLPEWDKKFRL